MKYRADIDCLRAFSVLLVIAFHFEITPWLKGGFIGVDVFFVISGFLITQVIVHHLKEDTFTLSSFYLRRAKRLLPAFYLVIFFSCLASYTIQSPNDLAELGHALRYAVTFHVNHLFANQTGYFEPDASLQPLLHIWSLNVEEQFYFIWPLILIALYRTPYFSKASQVALLLGLISLVMSHYWLRTEPSYSYYQLPSRAFEMLAGVWLALSINYLPVVSNRLSSIAQATSLFGLVSVAVLFDESTEFPGLNGLYPVVLTLVYLYSGHNQVKRVWLCNKFTVTLGQMSYSMYLWHWPLWVYSSYLFDMTLYDKIGLFVATMVVSFLSWKFVENPLRHAHISRKRYVFTWYFLFPVLVFLAISQWFEKTHGLPERMDLQAQRINRQINSESQIMRDSDEPELIIWGDSHGEHLRGMADYLLETNKTEYRIIGAGGCLPAVGVFNPDESDDNCLQASEHAIKTIIEKQPKHVLISARWGNYVQDINDSEYGPSLKAEFADRGTPKSKGAFLRQALLATIDEIQSRTSSQITLMFPVPTYPFDVANCLVRQHMQFNKQVDCRIDRTVFTHRQKVSLTILKQIIKDRQGINYIDPSIVLCDQRRCYPLQDDIALYLDNNHINYDGSRWLGEHLDGLGKLKVIK